MEAFSIIPFPSNSGTVLSVIQNCMGSWEKGYVLCGFPWMTETSFISIWFEHVLSSLFLSSINCRLLICSNSPFYCSALKLNNLQSINSLIVTYSHLYHEMRMVVNYNKWFACLKEWKLLFTDTCTWVYSKMHLIILIYWAAREAAINYFLFLCVCILNILGPLDFSGSTMQAKKFKKYRRSKMAEE